MADELKTPVRIQRRRTSGWRMPPNTVYVGRPSLWGNPFHRLHCFNPELSLALYREMALGGWNPGILPREWTDEYVDQLYRAAEAWKRRLNEHPRTAIVHTLRGQHLACWCPLLDPCHADILLEIANGGRR